MNHRHRKILHKLFAHPISANIPTRGVEAVLGALGAEVEAGHGGRLHVKLNGNQTVLGFHGVDLSPAEVQQVRRFLVDCGVDPANQYPL
jgi:hypothetical protein